MPTNLRPYTPQDIELLHEIDRQCFPRGIAYSRQDLKHYLRLPGANCIIAEVDGHAAGFCLTASEGDFGYIVTMDVLPGYRRQGVATALLARAENGLRGNGVSEVGLETATNNETAVLFWGKRGYEIRGVRRNYYPGNIDAYSMTKILTDPRKS